MFPLTNTPRATESSRTEARGWEAAVRAPDELDSAAAGVPVASPEWGVAAPEGPRERLQPGARDAFPSWRAAAGRALGLARAFVLLEDPALEAEAASAHEPATVPAHPHRQPPRPVLRPRRPGAAAPREHHCLTPVQHGHATRVPGWSPR